MKVKNKKYTLFSTDASTAGALTIEDADFIASRCRVKIFTRHKKKFYFVRRASLARGF
jgi:hypothetical protein